jgi:hypothetical protein
MVLYFKENGQGFLSLEKSLLLYIWNIVPKKKLKQMHGVDENV